MQSNASSSKPDLHDRSLREAFFSVVLKDPEVIALEREVADRLSMFSECLQTGQLPRWTIDYHWPLHISADTLAKGFCSIPFSSLDEARIKPSEAEIRAARLLSDRFSAFVNMLTRGEIVAMGTYWNNGLEQEISARTWTGTNLAIDVQNSNVCREGDASPTWSGVWLKRPSHLPVAAATPPNADKPTEQNVSFTSAETACTEWLKSLMAEPSSPLIAKSELWDQAKERWPGMLSYRGFGRCWGFALLQLEGNEHSARWSQAGRRPKSPEI
jgi:hypothetical protein